MGGDHRRRARCEDRITDEFFNWVKDNPEQAKMVGINLLANMDDKRVAGRIWAGVSTGLLGSRYAGWTPVAGGATLSGMAAYGDFTHALEQGHNAHDALQGALKGKVDSSANRNPCN